MHTDIMLYAAAIGLILGSYTAFGDVSASLIEPFLMLMLFLVFLSIDLKRMRESFTDIPLMPDCRILTEQRKREKRDPEGRIVKTVTPATVVKSVSDFFALVDGGASVEVIAEMWGIERHTLSNAVRGKTLCQRELRSPLSVRREPHPSQEGEGLRYRGHGVNRIVQVCYPPSQGEGEDPMSCEKGG